MPLVQGYLDVESAVRRAEGVCRLGQEHQAIDGCAHLVIVFASG